MFYLTFKLSLLIGDIFFDLFVEVCHSYKKYKRQVKIIYYTIPGNLVGWFRDWAYFQTITLARLLENRLIHTNIVSTLRLSCTTHTYRKREDNLLVSQDPNWITNSIYNLHSIWLHSFFSFCYFCCCLGVIFTVIFVVAFCCSCCCCCCCSCQLLCSWHGYICRFISPALASVVFSYCFLLSLMSMLWRVLTRAIIILNIS